MVCSIPGFLAAQSAHLSLPGTVVIKSWSAFSLRACWRLLIKAAMVIGWYKVTVQRRDAKQEDAADGACRCDSDAHYSKLDKNKNRKHKSQRVYCRNQKEKGHATSSMTEKRRAVDRQSNADGTAVSRASTQKRLASTVSAKGPALRQRNGYMYSPHAPRRRL